MPSAAKIKSFAGYGSAERLSRTRDAAAVGQLADAAQSHLWLVGEADDDVQLAAHRFDEALQRGQIHVRAGLQLGDGVLPNVQIRRELLLRHGPRPPQLCKRQLLLHRIGQGDSFALTVDR